MQRGVATFNFILPLVPLLGLTINCKTTCERRFEMENFSFKKANGDYRIVRGESDDFLEWPARATIVLMLSLVILFVILSACVEQA